MKINVWGLHSIKFGFDWCPKKQNNARKNSEHHFVEYQSSQSSMFDESTIFMIKTIVVLILICLPGNLFAISIFYKHAQKHHNTVERPKENQTYASNAKSATTHNDLAATGFTITTEAVSENQGAYFFIKRR